MNYSGYGFNANEIPYHEICRFMSRFHPTDFRKFAEYYSQFHDGDPLLTEIDLHSEEFAKLDMGCLEDFIWDQLGKPDMGSYLRDRINEAERVRTGETDMDMVELHGEFIVFENIRFSDDDEPRCKYIRTANDFIKMIGQYLDTKDICFGNIYEGSDFVDGDYWMD